MKKTETLSFHLALSSILEGARTSRDFDASQEFSKTFIHSLGLKVESGTWSTINLDSPKFPEFLERAEAVIRAKQATFYGFCTLTQELLDDGEAEWFQIRPNAEAETDIKDDGISYCQAYKLRAGKHVAHGMAFNTHVSDKFRQVVEKRHLTGLEFVWLPDNGRFRAAAQWYIPVAEQPLGRGLDHPWFDPDTLAGSNAWQPKSTRFRTGVWHFYIGQMKRQFDIGPVHERLLKLFSPSGLSIISWRAYLRSHLPTTDFAFNWRDEDSGDPGKVARRRGLCVNRKGRDILLQEKLVLPEEFEVIQIVDRLPRGVEKLDGKGELPTPLLTAREIESLQPKLEKLWKKHSAKEKPMRNVTMKEALSMLRTAKRERPHHFEKAASVDAIAKLKPSLPANWRAVLAITNGGILDPNGECEIVPISRLPDVIREKHELLKSLYDEYPFDCHHVPVAIAADGDWFSLAEKKQPDEDCRVFRVPHDDNTIRQEWESIPLFICDALAGCI